MEKPGCRHKISKSAKALVINAVLNAPREDFPNGIRLHIDDGWMGGGDTDGDGYTGDEGGGGSIPHENPMAQLRFNGGLWHRSDGVPDINDPNTIYRTYFTDERLGIFHYFVFCHDREMEPPRYPDLPNGLGWAMDSYDHGFIEEDYMKSDSMETKIFMHELGHNLSLSHLEEDSRVPDDADTCMQSTYSDSNPLNYYSEEWGIIDLPGSFT